MVKKKILTLTVLTALSLQAVCFQSFTATKNVESSITVFVKDKEQEEGTVWETDIIDVRTISRRKNYERSEIY